MALLAQFGELRFEITSSGALLFDNLKLTAECETEDKTDNSQKYVSKKNGKPVQISFTVLLKAALGIDVEQSVSYILYAAQGNVTERLYIGQTCIFPFRMMMTKADVEEIQISPGGIWTSAKVKVTLKQCTQEHMPQTQWKPYRTFQDGYDISSAISAVVSTTNAAKSAESTISKL